MSSCLAPAVLLAKSRHLCGKILALYSSAELQSRVLRRRSRAERSIVLQILDAARVTMASGETLDFSGFYIVFTSNIAASEILNLQHSSFTTMERHVLAKTQQTLRPELFARITEKLVFNRLGYNAQMEIARMHIARELAFLRSKGFNLTIGHFVVSFLMQRGFHLDLAHDRYGIQLKGTYAAQLRMRY